MTDTIRIPHAMLSMAREIARSATEGWHGGGPHGICTSNGFTGLVVDGFTYIAAEDEKNLTAEIKFNGDPFLSSDESGEIVRFHYTRYNAPETVYQHFSRIYDKQLPRQSTTKLHKDLLESANAIVHYLVARRARFASFDVAAAIVYCLGNCNFKDYIEAWAALAKINQKVAELGAEWQPSFTQLLGARPTWFQFQGDGLTLSSTAHDIARAWEIAARRRLVRIAKTRKKESSHEQKA